MVDRLLLLVLLLLLLRLAWCASRSHKVYETNLSTLIVIVITFVVIGARHCIARKLQLMSLSILARTIQI